ncbi:hypothetical protein MTR67_052385 [Solanum verrucosum]|uniref:RNase H type-1 domain-containing protein n=1 Tax=Solanum verrucosum TaxID=315347 RepID=A0AAF1A379_SOLVR|nr:hypothetical protein MTR67_052385 [Solanum verrucosum]
MDNIRLEDVRCKIGQALGGTVDVVIPGNGNKKGRYMRLKVMMNISKPLPRGEEDKCSKLPPDKNTYDATAKENEDAAQMNTKDLTENINQGIIIINQIEGHKGINTYKLEQKIRENEGIIQERLDRVLVSPNWKIKFENANVQHIETEASDHFALMLSSDAEQLRKKKWFYIDKRWIECEGVQNIISKAWSYDCNGFEQSRVSFKLKHSRRSLVAWLRGANGNARKRIISIKGKITALRNNASNFDWSKLRLLKRELSKAYNDEETFWKQKSRALWLREGDKNTSYFHMATLQRRNRNMIKGFQISDGRWVVDQSDIIQEVEQYYNAVFAMHPLKAPGVDDAGLQNYDGRASIGIVALDSLGNLLHAHGSPIQFVGKVKTAEAIAIRKALKYAISKGWKRVKILSDAKNVVDMIQKRVTTSWEIEVLCEDIWKLSSMFNHVEFIYISRSVNKIADRLARYSISLLKEISWEKFFPSWIIQDAKDMFKLCIPLMQ